MIEAATAVEMLQLGQEAEELMDSPTTMLLPVPLHVQEAREVLIVGPDRTAPASSLISPLQFTVMNRVDLALTPQHPQHLPLTRHCNLDLLH